MKKVMLGVLFGICLFASAFAEDIVFSDISANHWAKKQVYKIVELGVTRGYPDGTFRGNKTLNRYEVAVFLANLAEALERKIEDMSSAAVQTESKPVDTSSAVSARLLNELKSELNALEAEVAVLKAGEPGTSEGWSVSGKLTTRALINKFLGSDTTRAQSTYQRANLSLKKTLPGDAGVALNYDTDYMAFNGGQDLPTDKAFSVVAKAKATVLDFPLDLEASSGRGLDTDQVGEPVLAPEDKIKVSTKWGAFDIIAQFIQRSAETKLLKGEVKTVLPTDILGPTDINVGVLNYYTGVNPLNETKDFQLFGEFSAMPSEKIKVGGSIILGEMFETKKMALGAVTEVNDFLNDGLQLNASVYKYGSDFFNPVLDGSLTEYGALKVNAYGYWVGVNGASSTKIIGTDLAVSGTQALDAKTKLTGRLWMPFTGTFTKAIFTKLGVVLTHTINSSMLVSARYDYTSYGEGAITSLYNQKSTDTVDIMATLNF